MKKPRYFFTSVDIALAIEFMSDKAAGQLFKAACAYSQNQDRECALQYVSDNVKLRAFFNKIADHIDEGILHYQERCEKNRRNVMKRYEGIISKPAEKAHDVEVVLYSTTEQSDKIGGEYDEDNTGR